MVDPSFWTLIREDYLAHKRDWTRAGFQALIVYRFGVWRMGVKPRLLRVPLSAVYKGLFRTICNFYGIEIPYTAKIGRRVVFEHQHGIIVHGNTVIGDDCTIRQGVTLGIRRPDRLTDAPTLERGVQLGCGAAILGKVTIGEFAEIGANAVVLQDVPAHTLAAGVPAKIVKRHLPSIREAPAQPVAPIAKGEPS